ncbi:Rv3235 family protein [Streptosporangium sp. NPDC000396]|uniref:Rv3235 family protein n=1 Tax=Streptosporangium sp. NPDC000396 TaxID=3366185 RepID=UPI0036BF5923
MSRPPRPVSLPRIAPSPRTEPPYDDERPPGDIPAAAPPYVQGALALDYEPEPVDSRAHRPLVWGPPGAIPDGRRLRALCQAVAEILAGRRPPSSVSSHMTGRAHAELVRSGKIINCTRPPLVGTPHVSQPEDGVVEMCVLVHCGDRPRVLALRLERQGVQWLCTDFEATP